jgi:hypothetical protein
MLRGLREGRAKEQGGEKGTATFHGPNLGRQPRRQGLRLGLKAGFPLRFAPDPPPVRAGRSEPSAR